MRDFFLSFYFFSAESMSEHHVRNKIEYSWVCVDEYFIHVSGAAISQIVREIRFGTRQTNMFLNPCLTFWVSCRLIAAIRRIPAHSCPSYASLAFALHTFFSQVNLSYYQIALNTWSKNDLPGIF